LLKELSKASGSTLIVVTHDDAVAQKFDLRMHMQDGKLLVN